MLVARISLQDGETQNNLERTSGSHLVSLLKEGSTLKLNRNLKWCQVTDP